MTFLGIAALIALVVFGVMVLRVKSDPLEDETIREALEESKRSKNVAPPDGSQDPDSTTPTDLRSTP
jgi:hypothetical protein